MCLLHRIFEVWLSGTRIRASLVSKKTTSTIVSISVARGDAFKARPLNLLLLLLFQKFWHILLILRLIFLDLMRWESVCGLGTASSENLTVFLCHILQKVQLLLLCLVVNMRCQLSLHYHIVSHSFVVHREANFFAWIGDSRRIFTMDLLIVVVSHHHIIDAIEGGGLCCRVLLRFFS